MYRDTKMVRPKPLVGGRNRLSSREGRMSSMSSRMACCPLKRTKRPKFWFL